MVVVLLLTCFSFRAFAQSKDSIVIGECISLTGSLASLSAPSHYGALLRIEEINAAGGLLGRPVRLATIDDSSHSLSTAKAANQLIGAQKVTILLGGMISSYSRGIAITAQNANVPCICYSTNKDITSIGPYIFRSCFIDSLQGVAMAKFAIYILHATKAAVIADAVQDYSYELSQAFCKEFFRLRDTIVSMQSYSTGQNNFSTLLSNLAKEKPDVIYIAGYSTECSQLIQSLRKAGIKAPILGGDSWDTPELISGNSIDYNNCYFTNHSAMDDTSASMKAFVARYTARFKTPPTFASALGYNAVTMAAQAISASGNTNPVTIQKALTSMTEFPGVNGAVRMSAERNAIPFIVVEELVNGIARYHSNIEIF